MRCGDDGDGSRGDDGDASRVRVALSVGEGASALKRGNGDGGGLGGQMATRVGEAQGDDSGDGDRAMGEASREGSSAE